MATVDYKSLSSELLSVDNALHRRFRALFTLRAFPTAEAVGIISQAFSDESALLKHELAYVLGQMQNPLAIPVLSRVLDDLNENPMVRHEAGEALGAIGDQSAIAILEKHLHDQNKAVSETCELALDRIRNYEPQQFDGTVFGSVDPAPPHKAKLSVSSLRSKLLDVSSSLYERYRAMFSLRNRNSEEAVLALCDGLDDSSALFRHEIGYVLGQMQHVASVPALRKVMMRTDEVDMVRHECAEALGSIATEECTEFLKQFVSDPQRVVAESCVVALDLAEWENSEQLQYSLPIAQE